MRSSSLDFDPGTLRQCTQCRPPPVAAKLAKISKRIRWHTSRHTYSSLLAHTGSSMRVVQELLRHAKLSTTMESKLARMDKKQRAPQRARLSWVVLKLNGNDLCCPLYPKQDLFPRCSKIGQRVSTASLAAPCCLAQPNTSACPPSTNSIRQKTRLRSSASMQRPTIWRSSRATPTLAVVG